MSKQNNYHNTTAQAGAILVTYAEKAKTQDEEVLEIFKRYSKLTASEAFRWYQDEHSTDVPLTSIRRAISNLSKEGALTKTDDQRTGIYGRPEYVYKLTSHEKPESAQS